MQFGPPLEGGERTLLLHARSPARPIRLAVASRGIVWDDLHGQPARFTFSVASSLEAYEEQVAELPAAARSAGSRVSRCCSSPRSRCCCAGCSQPVRRLEREIKEVEAGTREQLGDEWPRELTAVTSNLNALLDGERTRIQRYRDTLGNLAHSLKTPLAVMRQSLGSGEARGKAALNAEIDRMSGIIEHQMKRAATSGGVLFGQAPVDVAPIVTRAARARCSRSTATRTCRSKPRSRRTRSSSAIAPISPSCSATCSTTPASGAEVARAHRGVRSSQGAIRARAATRHRRRRPGIAESDRAQGARSAAAAPTRRRPAMASACRWCTTRSRCTAARCASTARALGGARFELALPGRAALRLTRSGPFCRSRPYGPSLISNVMPCASGSSRLQLIVFVCRRM